MEMQLTYEGLQAELSAATSKQEKEVEEFGNYLERQFQSGQMSPGEPADRQMIRDLGSAEEHLQRLYSYSGSLAERESRGVPLDHPRENAFVEELLEVLD